MITGRGAGALLTGMLLIGLTTVTGCSVLSPGPTVPTVDNPATVAVASDLLAPIDREAATGVLLSVLPDTLGPGYVVEQGDGIDDFSLTIEDGIDDHDPRRVAGARRTYTSPGWTDARQGPQLWVVIDLFLMESIGAADYVMTDRSVDAETYTIETEFASVEEYTTMERLPIFPFGTIQRRVVETWSNGQSAEGWTAWLSSGEVHAMISVRSTLDAPSTSALDAILNTHVAAFIEQLDELPARLEELR